MCACAYLYAYIHMAVGPKTTFEVNFPFPPHGLQVLNSGMHA